MKTRLRNVQTAAIAAAMLLAHATTQAAMTVNFVGLEVDATSAGYRSTDIAKQYDADNVYGSLGYIAYGTTPVGTAGYWTELSTTDPLEYASGNRTTLKSIPPTLTVSTNNSGGHANRMSGGTWQPAVDDPSQAPGSGVADLQSAVFYHDVTNTSVVSMLNIGFNVGLGSDVLLIGIAVDANVGANKPSVVALVQTTGGAASDSVTLGSGSLSTNGMLFAFFEVSGAVAGDVLTIQLTPGSEGVSGSGYKASLLGVTMDTIPEPATAGLLACGGAALLARRRHD